MGVPHLPVWPISQAGTAVLVFDMGVWQITLGQILALGLSEAVSSEMLSYELMVFTILCFPSTSSCTLERIGTPSADIHVGG